MTAFIKQEAEEKAKEIEIKANEEFAIEKSKLVRSEQAAIDALYERKFKQAALAQQIDKSKVSNKTRLRVLSARQELLENLFDEARGKLAGVSKDNAAYAKIIEGLVLEGAYALMEDNIAVKAKKSEFDVVKKAMKNASSAYNSHTGQVISIKLDESDPLSEEISGGVSIVGGRGRIDINNTLEERLSILKDEALPSVRLTLFGPSPNRRFFD